MPKVDGIGKFRYSLSLSYHSLNRDRLLLILRIYIFLRFQVSGFRGERSDNEELYGCGVPSCLDKVVTCAVSPLPGKPVNDKGSGHANYLDILHNR